MKQKHDEINLQGSSVSTERLVILILKAFQKIAKSHQRKNRLNKIVPFILSRVLIFMFCKIQNTSENIKYFIICSQYDIFQIFLKYRTSLMVYF